VNPGGQNIECLSTAPIEIDLRSDASSMQGLDGDLPEGCSSLDELALLSSAINCIFSFSEDCILALYENNVRYSPICCERENRKKF
jgi:hypothetical protein